MQFPYTQKQKGGSDSGVFAIAFAFHAAMGDNISGDQLKMKCLRKQKFIPFPNLDKQSKKVCTEKIDVYCTCLMPDTYGDMVQCENCHKWFHIKCVGPLTLPNYDDKWFMLFLYVRRRYSFNRFLFLSLTVNSFPPHPHPLQLHLHLTLQK